MSEDRDNAFEKLSPELQQFSCMTDAIPHTVATIGGVWEASPAMCPGVSSKCVNVVNPTRSIDLADHIGVVLLLMTETSYMCVPKVVFLKTVFVYIFSRDLNIFHFCKKQNNKLAKLVILFFTEMENI